MTEVKFKEVNDNLGWSKDYLLSIFITNMNSVLSKDSPLWKYHGSTEKALVVTFWTFFPPSDVNYANVNL